MITLDDVKFSYKKGREALTGASCAIGDGIHVLLGPNGAGKTTLLKVISGLLIPEQGECMIDSDNISLRRPSDLQRVFFLADDALFPLSTINEMAERHAPFYPRFSCDLLGANLAAFGLTGDEKFIEMSLGMRKKSNVAYALALGVDVLLLDEPANGMDITSKRTLNRVIASSVADGQTVIVATHTVHEMRNLFDGVILIDHGRVALCSTVYDISSRYAFVVSQQPIAGAIYSESDISGHHCLLPNTDGIETPIDYELLYGAIANGAFLEL